MTTECGSRGWVYRADEKRMRLAVRVVLAFVGVVLWSLIAPRAAQAQSFSVIFNFDTASGEVPLGGVLVDSAGNLYGTASAGGNYGYGTVFELPPAGGETTTYNFTGGADGATPFLTTAPRDAAGNVYGVTPFGGILSNTCVIGSCGVVFKVTPAGKETALYSFTGGADGSYPYSALLRDSAGSLYGLAAHGGSFDGPCDPYGCGVVFKLSKSGQETVLYTFTGGADGSFPRLGLVRDGVGNLYGSTAGGGANGYGVIFKLDTSGNETVLYSFSGGSDGGEPGLLTQDAQGNLYGTTIVGGGGSCTTGCGTVFELTANGDFTTLYSFTGGPDGGIPGSALVRDPKGNLYGSTTAGGSFGTCAPAGCGVVFRLDQTGRERVLHTFTLGDGNTPIGSLALYKGFLYGTTESGGTHSAGVAFKVGPVD